MERRLRSSRIMSIACILLAAVSVSCLVFAFDASQKSSRAEQRSATNRYLICLLIQKNKINTGHCEDLDIPE